MLTTKTPVANVGIGKRRWEGATMLSEQLLANIDTGDKLWTLRHERGWSQVELARRSGVAQSTINYLELGKRVPTIQTLRKLARAYDTTATELMRAYENESKTPENYQVEGAKI
jgi:transcriptional regulator with XRE-family HTH domain